MANSARSLQQNDTFTIARGCVFGWHFISSFILCSYGVARSFDRVVVLETEIDISRISYFNTHPNSQRATSIKHIIHVWTWMGETQKLLFVFLYGLNTLNQIISKSIKLNDFLIKLQQHLGSTLWLSTGKTGNILLLGSDVFDSS